MTGLSILWRRLDQPGHESARLLSRPPRRHLAGTAVFAHDRQPSRLDYLVVCDAGWRTVSGTVTGWVGGETVKTEVAVDPAGRLPIRRLDLAVGEEAAVRAAPSSGTSR